MQSILKLLLFFSIMLTVSCGGEEANLPTPTTPETPTVTPTTPTTTTGNEQYLNEKSSYILTKRNYPLLN